MALIEFSAEHTKYTGMKVNISIEDAAVEKNMKGRPAEKILMSPDSARQLEFSVDIQY
jgi:hypothetical protein